MPLSCDPRSALRSRAGQELALAILLLCAGARFAPAMAAPFEDAYADLVRRLDGQRVGLLTNPTGVDPRMTSLVDRLHRRASIRLVRLFAPEHGLRGEAQAGDRVGDQTDPVTGLPVVTLYGDRTRPDPETLADLDVLVFDIQDVGTRFYTYVWTMTEVLEATARAGVTLVVFDRPNPLGLDRIEGPVHRVDAGLVGRLFGRARSGIPLRHGMTAGEIARLVNQDWLPEPGRLQVVAVPGYGAGVDFAETGYPWVMPSPNMPTRDTARVYPGTGLVEGTNLSEGRGTTRPFEIVGAPFLDGVALASRLNGSGLPGVRFRPVSFVPTFSKHRGEICHGVQVHVTDPGSFRAVRTGLTLIDTVARRHPEAFRVTGFIDRLIGIPGFHRLVGRVPVETLLARWEAEHARFESARQPALLYPRRP